MSRFGLFESSNELVFEPAYKAGARIVLALGDSLETLKTMPDGAATLVITSPPYNIGKEYETQTKLAHYLDSLLPMLKELVRVMSSRGSLCWQVGNYVEDAEVFPLDLWFYPIFKRLGLKPLNWWNVASWRSQN